MRPVDFAAPVGPGALSRVRLDVRWAQRVSALHPFHIRSIPGVLALEQRELSLLCALSRSAGRLLVDGRRRWLRGLAIQFVEERYQAGNRTLALSYLARLIDTC